MLFKNKKAAVSPSSILTGASAAAGAAKGVGGSILGGIGFGLGSNLTNNLFSGLPLILFSLLADLIAINALLKGQSAIMIHIIFGVFLFFMRKRDPLVLLMLALSLLYTFTGILPASTITTVLANTVANPFIPWWFIYAGFLRNERKGKLATIIFFFIFFVLLSVGYMYGGEEIAKAANLDERITPEQVAAYETGRTGIVTSFGKLFTDVKNGITSAPKAISNFINPKIQAAGGESLFGTEKEEQPKLGIVLEKHPSGAMTRTIKTNETKEICEFKKDSANKDVIDPVTNEKVIDEETCKMVEVEVTKEQTITKALITVPNPLEDMSFLTITNMKCYHEKSETTAGEITGRILEYPKGLPEDGVKIFYNRPITVSCAFDKDEIAGISTVTLAVGYNFKSNAKMITYVMKEDLLEDLLIRNEDPLDFMAVPSGNRRPTTRYDNGPAKFGIGPIELKNPPLGLKAETTTPPDFELVIGNKADLFNGVISRVNGIAITLPKGFSLVDTPINPCMFTNVDGKYLIKEGVVEENTLKFENIRTSRLFTCPMNITTIEALGGASFSQVEFDIDVDFTYEAEISLSTRVKT